MEKITVNTLRADKLRAAVARARRLALRADKLKAETRVAA